MRAIVRSTPFALLLTACVVAQGSMTREKADELFAAAKAEFAPDRRTVVFDVTFEPAGRGLRVGGRIHDAALADRLRTWLGERVRGRIEDELRPLPDPDLGDGTIGIVAVSVANLRSKPGHAQELGTQVLLGTPLRLLERQDGWYHVQTPNDYLCWTNDRMQVMTPAEFEAWRRLPKVVVTDAFAIVRAACDADARPVGDVVAGCILGLRGTAGGSHEVAYADGRTGFLSATAAVPLEGWLQRPPATGADIVATARRFFGVPYLWGGTSCKGMDCSGFTSTVYFLNGVLLPRDASQQVHVGVVVDPGSARRDLQAGDLLFFGRKATAERPERVTHVGISLGGARFIHSSTDVHENSFDPHDADFSKSLRDSLLHARRVLGAGVEHGIHRLADSPFYRKP